MSSSQPDILVITGGWHHPESYAGFTKSLEAEGFTVHVPRLPSMNGERPPVADLNADTLFIRNHVEELLQRGTSVAVVMHSYGGQVGTNALSDLNKSQAQDGRGCVTHLIYVTAFAQPEGWSMIDKVAEFQQTDLIPLAFDFDDDQTVINRNPKMLLVGDTTLAETEVDAYVATLARWNGKCMYDRISSCAWKDVDGIGYVFTTQDMTVPLDYQKSMVKVMTDAGRKVRTFELHTGHCPNFTATSGLVYAVLEFLGHSWKSNV